MTRPLTIVSTGAFGADSIALFERAVPGIRFYQFPKATPDELPTDVLAQADVYYAYSEPPSRAAAPSYAGCRCTGPAWTRRSTPPSSHLVR